MCFESRAEKKLVLVVDQKKHTIVAQVTPMYVEEIFEVVKKAINEILHVIYSNRIIVIVEAESDWKEAKRVREAPKAPKGGTVETWAS